MSTTPATTTRNDAVAIWTEVLDDLDARLDAQAEALAARRFDDLARTFDAPAVPCPVPAALLDRADALWRRGEALTADMSALLWAIGEELATPSAPPRATPERPSMLDARV